MESKNINSTLAKALGVDTKVITDLNSALAESLRDSSLQLDSVSLPGFGTFVSKKIPESIVTTPEGQRRLVPPTIELIFRPSVVLRKRLTE